MMNKPAPAISAQADEMRLQRYLARCGVASRRSAEELIVAGRVTVNGQVVQVLGTKVDPRRDAVAVDGAIVGQQSEDITIMLHKPAGYVSAMEDPQGRKCVSSLVPVDRYPSLFHLGRLDRDTSGLLLFSTDGDLGNGLLHPSHEVQKVYIAHVKGRPSADRIQMLREGVYIEDRLTAPALVDVLTAEDEQWARQVMNEEARGGSGRMQAHQGRRAYERRKDSSYLRIAIHEGRNRQVRRMCEAVGHEVIALHRQQFGPLDLGDVPRGSWRELTAHEVELLRELAFGGGGNFKETSGTSAHA